jgi:hypothetical protein
MRTAHTALKGAGASDGEGSFIPLTKREALCDNDAVNCLS